MGVCVHAGANARCLLAHIRQSVVNILISFATIHLTLRPFPHPPPPDLHTSCQALKVLISTICITASVTRVIILRLCVAHEVWGLVTRLITTRLC